MTAAAGLARGADRVLNWILYLILLLFFALCCYAIVDAVEIYTGASVDDALLQYKPEENAGLNSPSLEELAQINPDVRAWITVDDTPIDYPVLQGKDNVEYVNTDVYGEFRLSGSIFLDAANAPDFSDGYSLLYGHHMENDAMFGALDNFLEKEYFDQLNNFYLKHRETINKDKIALMSWRAVENNGHWTINKNSATDGDLFIAQALLLASKQWHDDKYQKEAHAILQDILRYEYNPDTETLTVGDWADSKSKYYNLMRTSDVMPEFFDNFYQETDDKRWLVIKNTMLKRLNQLSHQNKTGLVPDFAWVSKNDAKPVKPKTISTENDGYYSANACRVPMMLAGCNDRSAQNTLKRMLKFFSKQNTITAGYTLKGKPLNKYQSASFSAPIFDAVSFNRNEGYDDLFMSQQYIFTRHLPRNNYYDAALTTMAALDADKL